MNCPRCGFTFASSMNFCPNCGLQIKKTTNQYNQKPNAPPQQRRAPMSQQRNTQQSAYDSYQPSYQRNQQKNTNSISKDIDSQEYMSYSEFDRIDTTPHKKHPKVGRIEEYRLDTSYHDDYADIPSQQIPSSNDYFPRTTPIDPVSPKSKNKIVPQNRYRTPPEEIETYSPRQQEQYRREKPISQQYGNNVAPPSPNSLYRTPPQSKLPYQPENYNMRQSDRDDWMREMDSKRNKPNLNDDYSPPILNNNRSTVSSETTTLPPRFRRKAESNYIASNYNDNAVVDDDDDDDDDYEKKSIFSRPIFWILIILVVALAICTVLQVSGIIDFSSKIGGIFSGNDETPSQVSNEGVENDGNSEQPSSEVNLEDNNNISFNKLDNVPEDQMFKIGESITISSYDFKVNSVEPVSATSEDVPEEGKEFYLVNVSIKNTSSSDISLNPYYIELISIVDGEELVFQQQATSINTDTIIKSGELDAGDTIEGTVVIAVNKNVDNLYLAFIPDTSKIIVKVK